MGFADRERLTPTRVTKAARVTLPTYPAFCAVVGVDLLLADKDRLLASPVYSVADSMFPIRGWGLLFIVIAVTLWLALALQWRTAYQVGLAILTGLMTVWSVVFAAAAIFGEATFSAFAYPGAIAVFAFASFRSINSRETDQ